MFHRIYILPGKFGRQDADSYLLTIIGSCDPFDGCLELVLGKFMKFRKEPFCLGLIFWTTRELEHNGFLWNFEKIWWNDVFIFVNRKVLFVVKIS